MKSNFDNTLTYIELILPILGELELVNWTSDELFIILKENKLFEKYSDEDLHIQVQKTLKYLLKSRFVELENNEFQITPWAIDILNSIKDEKNQINEDDPSYNSKIRDIDIKYTKQINTQIKKAYKIPNQQFFYKDILDYLYHHPSNKTRIQIIKTIIDKKYDFTEDQLGVLIGIINGNKNSAIINRLYNAFEKLKNDGLIKKEANQYKITKPKKEYQSSKKPKIKQTQDIKTVKPPVKIEDNNNTTNEDIPNVATFNMYCEMIFKILSNNYSSDINTITQNILNIIIPDNYDKSIFELFKNQVYKILKQMIQKQLIIKNKDDNYEITEKGFIQLNQDTTPSKPHFKTQTKPENPLTIFNKTYKQNNQLLPEKLLEKVKTCNPYFFEKLSLDLLNKMEFYKVKSFKGELTAKSNDGGVDGLIYLDPLSIKPVYFQSKRWKNNISRPEMQKFVGALNDKSADTGIYITTSSFTKGAIETAKTANIRLIDGKTLVKLMIKYKVGIKIQEYEIKMIDEDYFKD